MTRILCAVLVVSFAVLFGCSDGKIHTEGVTGKVTLDGSPIAGASVTFYPKVQGQGSSAYALTDANGVYHLQTALGKAGAGTTEGEYTVTVSKVEDVPNGKTKTEQGDIKIPLYDRKVIIPEKYGKVETSKFTYQVKAGQNEFNLELSSSEK